LFRFTHPRLGDYAHIFVIKWFFHFRIVILNDFFGCYWRFLALLGGYWALFGARSWGEVGRWLPTLDLYKPGLLEAMGGDLE
jgi:hypothetical protein